jgi:hypothetical protein
MCPISKVICCSFMFYYLSTKDWPCKEIVKLNLVLHQLNSLRVRAVGEGSDDIVCVRSDRVYCL